MKWTLFTICRICRIYYSNNINMGFEVLVSKGFRTHHPIYQGFSPDLKDALSIDISKTSSSVSKLVLYGKNWQSFSISCNAPSIDVYRFRKKEKLNLSIAVQFCVTSLIKTGTAVYAYFRRNISGEIFLSMGTSVKPRQILQSVGGRPIVCTSSFVSSKHVSSDRSISEAFLNNAQATTDMKIPTITNTFQNQLLFRLRGTILNSSLNKE